MIFAWGLVLTWSLEYSGVWVAPWSSCSLRHIYILMKQSLTTGCPWWGVQGRQWGSFPSGSGQFSRDEGRWELLAATTPGRWLPGWGTSSIYIMYIMYTLIQVQSITLLKYMLMYRLLLNWELNTVSLWYIWVINFQPTPLLYTQWGWHAHSISKYPDDVLK